MASGIRDKVAILGMGCSRFGERWESAADDLMLEAFGEALTDAGIERDAIEAGWLGVFYQEQSTSKSGLPLSMALRLPNVPVTRVENLCATGTEALRGAAYAVASGAVDIALAMGVEKLKDTGFAGLPERSRRAYPGDSVHLRQPVAAGEAGAAWVFTRSGGVWSQQGDKLVGAGTGPGTGQAKSVAISADGDTVIVGGPNDSTNIGAAWVYTRSGEAWTQRGKLVGTGGVGYVAQGTSVAISEDGSAIIVGGPDDNTDIGAAWIFAASGCTAPSIYVQPQSQSFRTAQSATLSAAAAGTAPISFQWYQGPSGDTSNPVGTNSSSLTTPTLTATTSY